MLTKEVFRSELRALLRAAELRCATVLDVNAGDLHRRLGGYPDPSLHRMPVCCDAMYDEQRACDITLLSPPKGKGASLTIRYALPR